MPYVTWPRIAVAILSVCVGASATASSVVRLRQFSEDPLLTAHSGDTVVLDTQPGDLPEATIPYELEQGTHKFCLAGKRSDFIGMVLKDLTGKTLFTMPKYGRCLTVALQEDGTYTLSVLHSKTLVESSKQLDYVESDLTGPPLIVPETGGIFTAVPVAGFWAIQPNPALDPQHRQGRLRVQLPFREFLNPSQPGPPVLTPSAAPLFADFSSPQMDEYSLLHPTGDKDPYPAAILPSAVGGQTYQWFQAPDTTVLSHSQVSEAIAINGGASLMFFAFLNDLGSYEATFFPGLCFAPDIFSSFTLNVYSESMPSSCNSNQSIHVAFRFFPDGAQIGSLYQGEAALFQQCGYKGKAAVFAWGAEDLTALDSTTTTIDNSAQSVQLGNNTALLWQTPLSEPAALAADTACIAGAPANSPQGHDFQVVPLDVLLTSSRATVLNRKCVNCKLKNANLSGADLSGWDLSGADLTGASLNNTKLNDAVLTGTKFSGVTFSCTDFSGTDQSHVTDLTQTALTKPQLIQILACPGALANTRLSTKDQPLDLTGIPLAGMSLQGAILDYATGLGGADLTGILLSNASLRYVNLSGAKLYAAQLNNANLDGANLSGAYLIKPPDGNGAAANLSGAFLRNVNLSKAQLGGANLVNGSFYGTVAAGQGTCATDPNTGFTASCATAAGATMNNTQFSGAYLFGVDFTGAQVQGVQFGNAVLAGANFANAVLSVDPSVGTNSGFSGAFLQGANLATAKLLGNISLADSFMDFSPQGNVMYLSLSGEHTVFPGYWNTPGAPVCAEMSYNGPLTAGQPLVPTANPYVTCADGSSYAAGCGPANPDGSNPHWKSPVDITQFASYQFNATYTNAPKPGQNAQCTPDPLWVPLNLSRRLRGTR